MAKRDIVRAAKRRGITIESADYYWTATPGEMVPQWEIRFGPELGHEIEFFADTSEAVEFIESSELFGAPEVQA
ncbi:hypothetical protein JH314_08265 [Xanthomonas campestris]|uniref:hypothetical protein n=1 Tax=Xanthomonas campestris TaxID=339 RepID=UPI0023686800|nr:hypothetical protein [Xanthomonas campestris]WDJ03384.1 hypothetical protein JH314_08265 [Xanthomonas campestris]